MFAWILKYIDRSILLLSNIRFEGWKYTLWLGTCLRLNLAWGLSSPVPWTLTVESPPVFPTEVFLCPSWDNGVNCGHSACTAWPLPLSFYLSPLWVPSMASWDLTGLDPSSGLCAEVWWAAVSVVSRISHLPGPTIYFYVSTAVVKKQSQCERTELLQSTFLRTLLLEGRSYF